MLTPCHGETIGPNTRRRPSRRSVGVGEAAAAILARIFSARAGQTATQVLDCASAATGLSLADGCWAAERGWSRCRAVIG
jgi:hypothetical protein